MDGCSVVERLIRSSQSLKVVYLGGNKFGDEGVRMLAEALKTNNQLVEI